MKINAATCNIRQGMQGVHAGLLFSTYAAVGENERGIVLEVDSSVVPKYSSRYL